MKKIIPVLFVFAVLSSCNNDKPDAEEQPGKPVASLDMQVVKMNEMIAKYPDSMDLRVALVAYYRDETGNDSMALLTADAGLRKDSTYADLWATKATVYLSVDDTLKAIAAFERAVELDAQPGYLRDLAYLCAFKKDPRTPQFADGLILTGKVDLRNEGLLVKGIYSSNIGRKDEALSIFNNIISQSPGYALAYREKAIVLYEQGKFADGIKTLERITTLQNSFADGYYWMGRCYEKLNNSAAAITNYQKTLYYDKEYEDARDALNNLGAPEAP